MSKFVDKVKDWFTDVLGAIMMVSSLWLVYENKIPFVWEGLTILLSGFVLMAVPDKEIAQAVKSWAAKKFGGRDER